MSAGRSTIKLGDCRVELLRDPLLHEPLASPTQAYVEQELMPEAAPHKLNSSYSVMELKAGGATA
jgi:hypothetical protein